MLVHGLLGSTYDFDAAGRPAVGALPGDRLRPSRQRLQHGPAGRGSDTDRSGLPAARGDPPSRRRATPDRRVLAGRRGGGSLGRALPRRRGRRGHRRRPRHALSPAGRAPGRLLRLPLLGRLVAGTLLVPIAYPVGHELLARPARRSRCRKRTRAPRWRWRCVRGPFATPPKTSSARPPTCACWPAGYRVLEVPFVVRGRRLRPDRAGGRVAGLSPAAARLTPDRGGRRRSRAAHHPPDRGGVGDRRRLGMADRAERAASA